MRTPFYMTFPIQNLYQAELEYEQDIMRMKAAYNADTRRLVALVEDYCDGLEFEGSRIYDEYPDATMLRRDAHRLYEQIGQSEEEEALIQVLFLNEILQRRCRFRRQHRWW